MWHVPEKFSVKLGGNTYINTPNLIVYKGTPIFKIRRSDDTGILGIDFDVYDAKGNRVATFAMGIVVQGDKDNYVITTGQYTFEKTKPCEQLGAFLQDLDSSLRQRYGTPTKDEKASPCKQRTEWHIDETQVNLIAEPDLAEQTMPTIIYRHMPTVEIVREADKRLGESKL